MTKFGIDSRLVFDENGKPLAETLSEYDESLSNVTEQVNAMYVTPLQFGAIGDGVADDTEAVRLAIKYAEENAVKVFLPSVFLVSDEIEVKQPIIIEGVGSSSNEGTLNTTVQISGLLMKRDTEKNKRIRTRMKYRASAADPQDAPLSVVLNIQSENVTLRDFSVKLWFNTSDNSPTNYGSPCDVGIFVGSRLHFVQQNIHVLGYFREASWWFDVTYHGFLPRFNDLSGVPYPNRVTAGGGDGTTMIKCYSRGGKWGVRVAGAQPKAGQVFDTTNGWYGTPFNMYYDELLGSTVQDRRGNYGFSDFTTIACSFFGTDHHSNYRRSNFASNYVTDTAGGSMYIDGMAGNVSGRLQGMRFFSTRFSSFEPYRVRLDRVQRVEFFGCHFESGSNGSKAPDGTLLTLTSADIYGHLTMTSLTDNVINIGSNTRTDPAYIGSGVRYHDYFSAHANQESNTTDNLKAKTLSGDSATVNSVIANTGDMDLRTIEWTAAQDVTPVYVRLRHGNATFGYMNKNWWRSAYDNATSLGTASGRWSVIHAGTGTISTSDRRKKTEINSIPDAVLDAWSEVNYSQFKFIDAVEEKGKGARLHFGLIAQEIEEVFNAHGLNAFDYGLLCYDEWEDGNLYSIRPDECMMLESALMRRELQRLKEGKR